MGTPLPGLFVRLGRFLSSQWQGRRKSWRQRESWDAGLGDNWDAGLRLGRSAGLGDNARAGTQVWRRDTNAPWNGGGNWSDKSWSASYRSGERLDKGAGKSLQGRAGGKPDAAA